MTTSKTSASSSTRYVGALVRGVHSFRGGPGDLWAERGDVVEMERRRQRERERE